MILVGLTPQSGAQELDPQNFVIENAYIALADAEDVPVLIRKTSSLKTPTLRWRTRKTSRSIY